MQTKRTILQPVTLVLLVVMLSHLYGCFTTPELEKTSPKIVSNGPPLSRDLGKVGINLATTEVTLQTPTSGALLKKQFWQSFVQGNAEGTEKYWKAIKPIGPFVFWMGTCSSSRRVIPCESKTAMVDFLAMSAIVAGSVTMGTVNGMVEAVSTKYSESTAHDLEQALFQAVAKANDELRNTIVASSRNILFQYMRQYGEGKAVTALDGSSITEVILPQMSRDEGLAPPSVPIGLEGIDSIIDARIRNVTFADTSGWFNSKLQLRIGVGTSIYRRNGAVLVDERTYECVSVPRTYRYWGLDSYKHIREEMVECNQLLGQQIANDLLGASMRTHPGIQAQ
jgi:hypothetical protein